MEPISVYLSSLNDEYGNGNEGGDAQRDIAAGCQSMFADYDHTAAHTCDAAFVSIGADHPHNEDDPVSGVKVLNALSGGMYTLLIAPIAPVVLAL